MTAQHETNYPIVDFPRDPGNTTVEDFGVIEPHFEPHDCFVALPVRVTHGGLTGWLIEVGPYDLGENDIETFRRALGTYDHVRLGDRLAP